MSIEYKETWFIVPRRISEIPGMTLAYLKIYESIFQFWNKDLNCFLSTEALCERTGVKRRQVFNALDFFERNGELERVQIGLKRYISKPRCKGITQECTPVHPSTEITQECTPVHSRGALQCTHECTGVHSPTLYEVKNLNKEINSFGHSANDREKKSDAQNTFSAFWDAYPIKKGKQLALKAWLRCMPDAALRIKIFSDLKLRLTRDKEWIDGCIPRAAKYMNEKIYEDEIKDCDLIKNKKEKEAEKNLAHRTKLQNDMYRNNESKKTDAVAYKKILSDPRLTASQCADGISHTSALIASLKAKS